MTRECKLCSKPIKAGDFYVGTPNRHKECHRRAAREYRLANIEHWLEYDRARAKDPDRVAARKAYIQTERGKKVKRETIKRWQEKNPVKRAAHIILNNFVRDGVINKPTHCQQCKAITPSRQLHAHHADYSRPLEVEWVCAGCHSDEHRSAS